MEMDAGSGATAPARSLVWKSGGARRKDARREVGPKGGSGGGRGEWGEGVNRRFGRHKPPGQHTHTHTHKEKKTQIGCGS